MHVRKCLTDQSLSIAHSLCAIRRLKELDMFFIPNPYADNVHLATAVFLEMPSFERYRAAFLEDGDLRALQLMLMQNPLTGMSFKALEACARHE